MSPAGLPLELQVGLLNPGQRKVLNGSRRGFEGDYAIFESGESAIPIAPAFHRIAQADSRLLALKPLIILGFEELAFHPGGTHFERITPARDDIFDIQDGAHLLRNHLAVAMRHALGFIDRNADKAVLSAALDFDLDQLHTLRSEEHTSELQSLRHLVCGLLLEKRGQSAFPLHRTHYRRTTPRMVTLPPEL